jgi:hypothetical protein
MEVHANTNENPAYHDVKLIENKMIASGFNLAKRFTYYSYNEKGESFHIGVYVEKWVRV